MVIRLCILPPHLIPPHLNNPFNNRRNLYTLTPYSFPSSSNMHIPSMNVSGSGIYEPGALLKFRDTPSKGSLLLEAG